MGSRLVSQADIEALEDRFGEDHVFVKNRRPRRGGDEDENPRQRRDRRVGRQTLPPKRQENLIRKEDTMKDTMTMTQTRPELESCPLCGGFKEKERKVADGKTVRLLTCGACSGGYRRYCDETTKAIVANPAEAPEPLSKFEWVLRQIDLARFREEAVKSVASYRNKYDVTVIAVLRQRGYLEGNPTWGAKDNDFRRPQMRFTRAAFQSGTGVAVRQQLEGGLNDTYKSMRRTLGRLEVATRVEPELRAAIAARAAAAEFVAEV